MNWIESRIKQAQEGATELDLSLGFSLEPGESDQLKELPPSILEMKHLEKLDLSNQPIVRLPKAFQKLDKLTHFSFTGNRNLDSNLPIMLPPSLSLLDLGFSGPINDKSLPLDYSSLPRLEILTLPYVINPRLLNSLSSLKHLRELHSYGSAPKLKVLTQIRNLRDLHTDASSLDGILPQLEQLESLTVLGRGYEGLESDIGTLPNLRKISLHGSELKALPRSWHKLSRLERMSIRNYEPQQFQGLDHFTLLPQMKSINLSGVITSLASILRHAIHLQELSYTNNLVEHLPSRLFELGKLTSLALIDTGLKEIPIDIIRLKCLKDLNLSGNNISILPEVLGQLSYLESLWIYGSELKEIPESLSALSRLKALSFGKSKLSSWPSFIFALSNLETLGLSEAQLNEVPLEIRHLTRLSNLRLNGNNINIIPSEVGRLPYLKHLDIANNPISSPPPELVAAGTAALQDYFADLDEVPSSRLFEAKLILVGEGDVGKTSLSMSIVNPTFNVQANQTIISTTKGISIAEWHVPTKDTDDFKINVWDFGGQEIYHHTHQFFLTKRSLYIFVWDARREDRVEGFDYWLNVVGLLSDGSPILVVLNKADVRIKEIDQKGLQEKFPNIVGFHKVSTFSRAGIDNLIQDIKGNISKLPHIGGEWPGRWTEVRSTIKEDSRNYIEYEEYLKLCGDAGLSRQKADTLSFTLHHLGVILHFQEDPILQKIVILKPDWGTNAVYAVLDTKDIQSRNGRFSFSELANIWGHTVYPLSKHAELLQLMIRFELCFQLEGSSEYIVPELLSASRPQLHWTGNDVLKFEYQYDFMPAGIITRFIARNHSLIEGSSYWRFGVLLSWEGTRALVVSEPLNRKIRAEVVGRERKELLAIIRRDFSQIHKTLNHPGVRQMIPCLCSQCRAGDPLLFNYDRVRNYFDNNVGEIVCDRSFEKLSTQLLLTGVYSKAELSTKAVEKGQIFNVENYYEGGAEPLPNRKQRDAVTRVPGPWASGSFYLFAAVVLFALIAAVANWLNWWVLPLVIVGGLLAVTVVGAFQLKQDLNLPSESFLKLMALAFRQLPLLKQAGGSDVKSESLDEK